MFKAGAGRAVIGYTSDMFPNFGEFYTGVHDDSYVQVVILEQNIRFALVAVGTVIVSEQDAIAAKVAEVTGVPVENVIVHAKHVLSAPHARRNETAEQMLENAKRRGIDLNKEDAEVYVRRNGLICDALIDAAASAAKGAADTLRPATMSFATGHTDVNVNRLVFTDKGWWQGHNPDIPADGSLPVLRFDAEDGTPIALLFFCNVAPGVLENSFLADGSRPASGDMAAGTERLLDAQYEGVVSIYMTGATGDHWQALRALHDTMDKDGHQTVTDLHEAGFILMDIISDRLKEAVIRANEKAQQQSCDTLALKRFTFTYEGQKAKGARMGQPSTEVEYEKTGDQQLGVDILRIGQDTAILFIGVEINSTTWALIREGSPFKNTMIVEFANKKGGGYLPTKDYYDKITYQSLKTRYYGGGAERLAEDVLKALKEMC